MPAPYVAKSAPIEEKGEESITPLLSEPLSGPGEDGDATDLLDEAGWHSLDHSWFKKELLNTANMPTPWLVQAATEAEAETEAETEGIHDSINGS
ncbi:hypothetical protein HYALB_00008108 [Hymenoscyphus albidus]|uniref:Uncharacterized protein n=1 Tax=Hymenoscyphus albidus TaxID=595503 RepID=A0A9N9M1R6_9HELO|nr:hypothetical protein HYALB_00008108 [Hymenoscyphus albidus]